MYIKSSAPIFTESTQTSYKIRPTIMSNKLTCGGPAQGCKDPLEKGMATHSSILAWEIPRTEKPGRLSSQSVRHNWVTNIFTFHEHTNQEWILRLNFELWLVMMCQCSSIHCNKCTALVRIVGNGVARRCRGHMGNHCTFPSILLLKLLFKGF